MDYTKILKRAWQILWEYRALWIFGMILALTTASFGQSSMFGGNNDSWQRDGEQLDLNPNEKIWPQIQQAFEEEFNSDLHDLNELFNDATLPETRERIFKFAYALLTVILVLYVIFKVLRYIAETALIKMVALNEETGEKTNIRGGFRMGWSAASWRLFLIDIVINWPLIVLFLGLFALAFSPLIPMISGYGPENLLGLVVAIGLFFGAIFLIFITAGALSLLKPLMRRASVLGDTGVIASIQKGFTLARENLKEVGVMWMILVGIEFVWGIVLIPVALFLIPVGILMGAATGGLVHALSIVSWDLPLVVLVAGIPVFLLTLIIPLAILDGLKETYRSSTWTLTYREVDQAGVKLPGESPAAAA
ncbi:MAG: hypothetical protein OEY93_00235 [Anaerolineae bacterium]|nr:hypothetical protein [Anaerolineae bacterium]